MVGALNAEIEFFKYCGKKLVKKLKNLENICIFGQLNIGTMEAIALRETSQASLRIATNNHVPTVRRSDMIALSPEDFNAMQETTYLLSHPTNAAHLLRSKHQLEHGFSKQISLAELGE